MRPRTPQAGGYRLAAEWEPHDAVWLAWPSHGNLWGEHLPKVQAEFVALCRQIVDADGDDAFAGEPIELLVPDGLRELEARNQLEGLPVKFHRVPFGDIWMRDVGPLFATGGRLQASEEQAAASDAAGAEELQKAGLLSLCFAFNGWGGKYILDGDELVGCRISQLLGTELYAFGWVLEGGAVEVDGEGTLMTTRSCLLNDNRNPGVSQEQIERNLAESFGAEKVLWLRRGLLNDHTDGHVDTIARFIGPGRVICMRPSGDDDPNKEALEEVFEDLGAFEDAQGRRLEVEQIPSPGKVVDDDELIMPASYLNYYIANTSVIVPTYGVDNDEEAVSAIAALFPERKVVGLSAKEILRGGGAFHCITRDQPAPKSDSSTKENCDG